MSRKKTKKAKKRDEEVVCGSEDEGRDALCTLAEGREEDEEEGTELPPGKKSKKEKKRKKKEKTTSDSRITPSVQNTDELIPKTGIKHTHKGFHPACILHYPILSWSTLYCEHCTTWFYN